MGLFEDKYAMLKDGFWFYFWEDIYFDMYAEGDEEFYKKWSRIDNDFKGRFPDFQSFLNWVKP